MSGCQGLETRGGDCRKVVTEDACAHETGVLTAEVGM